MSAPFSSRLGPALLLLVLLAPIASRAETEAQAALDGWLARQSEIQSWTAAVVQTRHLRSLAKPLESSGRVWFARPNQFRWQLGEPARTVAVRSGEELVITYPRLRQVERYSLGAEIAPMWRYVLDLLELGFPSDAESFHERYELTEATSKDGVWAFRLRPSAEEARTLLEAVRIEVSETDLRLVSTELIFPDGSRMKNRFSELRIDPPLEPALFEAEVGEDWEEARPLAK